MSLPIQDQANILHGIGGGWTMRTEIINALLLRETVNQRTTMEKWIGYEEEGSLIPRGRETLDMIEGFELRDNEILTLNRVIRLLAYTGHKWIVDLDPIKVQPVCNGHGAILMRFKETKVSLSSNSQPLKLPKSRLLQRSSTHIMFLTQLSPCFGKKSGNNNMCGELPCSNGY